MLEINVKSKGKIQIVRDFEPIEVMYSNAPNWLFRDAKKIYTEYFKEKYKNLIDYCYDWKLIPELDYFQLNVAVQSCFFEINRELGHLSRFMVRSNLETDNQIYNINQTIESYSKFLSDFEKMHIKTEPKKETIPVENGQLSLVM